jgi:hypothetical protein
MPLLHPLVERPAVVLWYLCAGAQVKKKERKERDRSSTHANANETGRALE